MIIITIDPVVKWFPLYFVGMVIISLVLAKIDEYFINKSNDKK